MYGFGSGGTLTTGSFNICLGYSAGGANTDTGSDNILIGKFVDLSASGVSNEINIGNVITGSMTTGPALMDGFTATTQSPGDNSDQIATTAYVDAAVSAGAAHATTFQYLTSGSGATYTTPANCKAILVQMVGAGGGGGAYVTNTGSAGGDTIFNSIHAKGGSGGGLGQGGAGGAGGTGGTGSASSRLAGAKGGSAYFNGGTGGATPFGGEGPGGTTGGTIAGSAGTANTGGGGGGGASGGNAATGAAGGGAGEYAEIYISSPSSTYTYTIGTGGAVAQKAPAVTEGPAVPALSK